MSEDDRQAHLRLLDLTDVPPEQGMAQLLEHAVRLRASDLFLVSNEQHVAAQVRLLGQLETISILTADQGRHYIAHLRAESGVSTDHRRPQDARWLYITDEERRIDLRISTIPTLHGEDLGVRLLSRDQNLLPLERLGMTSEQLQIYREMLDRSGEMLLLTGPTGSGKTVTLYASLQHLNDGRRKVHTIEDPIEYAIDGLRQSQVSTAIELNSSELLRGVLRQAPDAIMLGEIRDAETADTAVWAANSGTLVLATIHAPGAAAVIQSLHAFDVEAAFIAMSVRGAVSQRLLRTLCPACRDVSDEPDEVNNVQRALEEIETRLPAGSRCPTVFVARGCEECHHTGYAGRTAAFEILCVSDAIRSMIFKGRSPRQIRARAVAEGMLTLRQAGLLKVAQGLTTLEEVKRSIPDPERDRRVREPEGPSWQQPAAPSQPQRPRRASSL